MRLGDHLLAAILLVSLLAVLHAAAAAAERANQQLAACRREMLPSDASQCSLRPCSPGLYLGADCTCHGCPEPGDKPRQPAVRWRHFCIRLLGLCPEITTAGPQTSRSACQKAFTATDIASCPAAARAQPCRDAATYLAADCTCEACPTAAASPKLHCLRLLGLCESREAAVSTFAYSVTSSDQRYWTWTWKPIVEEKSSSSKGVSWSLLIMLICVILVAAPILAFFAYRRLRRPLAHEQPRTPNIFNAPVVPDDPEAEPLPTGQA